MTPEHKCFSSFWLLPLRLIQMGDRFELETNLQYNSWEREACICRYKLTETLSNACFRILNVSLPQYPLIFVGDILKRRLYVRLDRTGVRKTNFEALLASGSKYGFLFFASTLSKSNSMLQNLHRGLLDNWHCHPGHAMHECFLKGVRQWRCGRFKITFSLC